MARKISRRAATIAAVVTIAGSGLLIAGGPASAAAKPADSTVVAVTSTTPSGHSYGQDYATAWATDGAHSQYSDGYSWYRLDYGLLYRWDGNSWVAQTGADTDLVQTLNYRYDGGQYYQWNGSQWVSGADRHDDIAQAVTFGDRGGATAVPVDLSGH